MRTPYVQGTLDNLCGMYSIVNAMQIIFNYPLPHTQLLFDGILKRFVQTRGRLLSVMLYGMSAKAMTAILEDMASLGLAVTVPFRGVAVPTLDEFWKSMSAFLNEVPTKQRRAIILGMQGKHDHWSVVRQITSRSVTLYDSDGITRLLRHRCSTAPSKRMHQLQAAQTYYLQGEVK